MASNDAGRRLFKSLSRGQLAPIYMVYGEETFLVDEAVRAITKAALPDGGDDFSNQKFEGSEAPGLAIRQALENLSLFGGQRLVQVRNINQMPHKEQAALTPYFARPAPDTVLLFSDAQKLDRRRTFGKSLAACKEAVIVEFRSLYQNELAGWVQRRAARVGMSGLDRGVAEVIVALCGPDLAPMNSALEKLAIFTASLDRPLNEDDVLALLDDTRTRSVFDLTRLLGERKLPDSLDTLHRMLSAGNSGVAIVSMVARHFRIVWKVLNGSHDGVRGHQLARLAGCPPSFLSEYQRDSRRFSEDRLLHVIQAIYDTERGLKSSRLDDKFMLDDLIMRICL